MESGDGIGVTRIVPVSEVMKNYRPIFCGCCLEKKVMGFFHRTTGLLMCTEVFGKITGRPLPVHTLSENSPKRNESEGLDVAAVSGPIGSTQLHQGNNSGFCGSIAEQSSSDGIAITGGPASLVVDDVAKSKMTSQKRRLEESEESQMVLFPIKFVRLSDDQTVTNPVADVGAIYRFRRGKDVNIDYFSKLDGEKKTRQLPTVFQKSS